MNDKDNDQFLINNANDPLLWENDYPRVCKLLKKIFPDAFQAVAIDSNNDAFAAQQEDRIIKKIQEGVSLNNDITELIKLAYTKAEELEAFRNIYDTDDMPPFLEFILVLIKKHTLNKLNLVELHKKINFSRIKHIVNGGNLFCYPTNEDWESWIESIPQMLENESTQCKKILGLSRKSIPIDPTTLKESSALEILSGADDNLILELYIKYYAYLAETYRLFTLKIQCDLSIEISEKNLKSVAHQCIENCDREEENWPFLVLDKFSKYTKVTCPLQYKAYNAKALYIFYNYMHDANKKFQAPISINEAIAERKIIKQIEFHYINQWTELAKSQAESANACKLMLKLILNKLMLRKFTLSELILSKLILSKLTLNELTFTLCASIHKQLDKEKLSEQEFCDQLDKALQGKKNFYNAPDSEPETLLSSLKKRCEKICTFFNRFHTDASTPPQFPYHR